MGPLIEHGWTYPAAKAHMGQWYKAPTGMGAGVMGLGYWCFATNVARDDLPVAARPRAEAAVAPLEVLRDGRRRAHGRDRAGRDPGAAGERGLALQGGPRGRVDRPDQPRAHQPRHRPHDARRGLAVRVRAPRSAGSSRRAGLVNTCFFALLGGSLAFYFSALYLGFHEGALVVHRGLTPEQAEEATRAAPVPDHGRGDRDVRARSGCCSRSLVRSVWRAQSRLRPFVLAGCAALAVGTLQGPVQAVPAVNEAARPRRRGGRRDRQPARPAEHARGPDAAPDRARARLARAARRLVARAAGPARRSCSSRPGWACTTRRASRSRPSRRTGSTAGARSRQRSRRARAVGGARPRAGRARRARGFSAFAFAVWPMTAAPAGGRASDSRGGSARLHGQDPDARALAAARPRSPATSCRSG